MTTLNAAVSANISPFRKKALSIRSIEKGGLKRGFLMGLAVKCSVLVNMIVES